MSEYLCISVTFLDRRFHGRGDGGESEWPPSPLRLFQALVAANREAVGNGNEIGKALRWLECQPPPVILAPRAEKGVPFCLSVPNNAMDIVAKAWTRGNYFSTGKNANPAKHCTMKTLRPRRLIEDDMVRFFWPLSDAKVLSDVALEALTRAAGRMCALGWGIDMVVGHGESLATVPAEEATGERWNPSDTCTHNTLRVPTIGTLDALHKRYQSFRNRVSKRGFIPVDPLTHFKVIGYRRPNDPQDRPHIVFELRQNDGNFFRYPQRKLIHIAGMVRFLAIMAMDTTQGSPPTGIANAPEWVETYVAGHAKSGDSKHRQFSYLPLPSIGMTHTEPSVRRVMIAAPLGDERLLEHLALHLAGQKLRPKRGDEFGDQEPPTLVRVQRDRVARFYTAPANVWASVTPVILPGHDDHKPAKTIKLIEKALRQSGIDQPCTFEWRAASWRPQSLSAHKYDRNRKPAGYFRPKYLLSQTAVHLKLQFNDQANVSGPMVIGAGRHCGFGLMAGFNA